MRGAEPLRAWPSEDCRARVRRIGWALMTVWIAASGSACTDGRGAFAEFGAPTLERYCAAATCHGVAADAEQRGETLDWSRLLFRLDGNGHIADLEAARRAALRTADTKGDPLHSSLLRKNLYPGQGLPHAGGPIFRDPSHPGAQALLRWLRAEDGGAGGEGGVPLNELERQFAETVQPHLLAGGCALANCHGVASPVPLRLDSGGPAGPGVAASRSNYEAARRMLALGGDGSQSRLLRKALAIQEGGIPHRVGLSGRIGAADGAAAAAISAWACSERRERGAGVGCDENAADAPDSVVFELGPADGSGLFSLDTYAAGTRIAIARRAGDGSFTIDPAADADLFLDACGGAPKGVCDRRDPAPNAAADRIVAAVRPGPGEGRALWLRPLEHGPPIPLTRDLPCPWQDGCHDRDPTFGPGGRLYFVSDRGGGFADDGGRSSELFELDLDASALRRRTFSPHRVRWPAPFVVGSETFGTIGVTLLRDVIPAARKAHPFRLAPDLHTELHQHFGVTFPFEAMIATVELADGRYAAITLPLDATSTFGDLLLVDRNLGPALPVSLDAGKASMPGYLQPYAAVAAEELGAVAVADPAALGGRGLLLAARREDGRSGLMQVTVVARQGVVGAIEQPRWLLLAPVGDEVRNPQPLLRRPPAPGWETEYGNAAVTHGLLVHQGVPMIDQLISALPPQGERSPRMDLVAARLLTPLALPASERATATLGSTLPVRVLAHVPLAADGSFQAKVPARTPYRIQAVAADGMAAGTPHNRWLHHEPGQRLPQGVSSRIDGPYRQQCATCHGARDGDPSHTLPNGFDIMSSASWTLSRYAGGDPRRPLPPAHVAPQAGVEVDFRRDIQPILDARCASATCHGGSSPAAALDLRGIEDGPFTRSYAALLQLGPGSGGGRRWVDGSGVGARRSALAERLLGVELEAPALVPLPPQPHGALSDQERATVLLWLDMGASYVGAALAPVEGP